MPVRKPGILGAEVIIVKAWGRALRSFWARRGFYVLLVVCLMAVAGAAVYARTRLIAAPVPQSGRAGAYPAAAGVPTPSPSPSPSPTPAPEEALLWPVSGREILRDYSDQPAWYAPLGLYETHPGVDIRTAAGTAVVAAADGVVTRAGYDARRGYLVETREGELVLRYANLAKSLQVSPGDRVRRGQALGTVGSSAPDARVTGPFLYFEAFRGGARVALP